MSHKLIGHSPDLKRLRDEGFELEIKHGHLLMHHVPYVNSAKEVKFGTLVSALTLSGDKTTRPESHVAMFIGEHPCHKDGAFMAQIKNASTTTVLGEGLTIHHTFSSKPLKGHYDDYYEKVTTYVNIISSPAKALADVSEKTFKIIEGDQESVFEYIDTNSSRAQINQISSKLQNQVIAIVGLGGSGSYVLDLVAKTPVREIRLFDGDDYLQHNAFRSPGAPPLRKLRARPRKTAYWKHIYSKMHRHIISNPVHLNESNLDKLIGVTFVFICMDDGKAKKPIIDYLLQHGVPFIDVGLGIQLVQGMDTLIGIIRTTTATATKHDHLSRRVSFAEAADDLYTQNIQIADLNSLNASLAVIKWKKLCGFYQDLEKEHNTTYTINTAQLLNEELGT